jgi:hypothetical protein
MTTGNSSAILGGVRVPKALINATSTTGSSADTVTNNGSQQGLKFVTSGALTAGVLATVLSISGAGQIPAFLCRGADATARTHRLKMTVDGVVVYDATTASVSATNRGIALVGFSTFNINCTISDPVNFNKSLLIEYASSVTETDLTSFLYIYKTY